MSKEYTFLSLAFDVLNQSGVPMTVDEIWSFAVQNGLAQKLNSKGLTPARSIGARVYTDIKTTPNTQFIRVQTHPVRFGLRDKQYIQKPRLDGFHIENPQKSISYERQNERHLHPLLTRFVFSHPHFQCYTKTIYHETSHKRKKGLNEWIHPDMVGVYLPFGGDYQKETLNVLQHLQENPYKIFSFEMKRKVDKSNYKEYFFQAVSNSSWAHEGYLVTLNLEENDEELLADLGRLSRFFGIGVIKLNIDDIDQSKILFPANFKREIDIETLDLLVEENDDMRDFLENVDKDVKVQEVHPEKYDKYYKDLEMEEHIRKNNLKHSN